MLTEYLGTPLDRTQKAATCSPGALFLLYSRNIDSDSAIISGTAIQTPIDITPCVKTAQLTLGSDRDSSSLSITVALESNLTPDLFANAAIALTEGDETIDVNDWVPTFWGIHVGQPQASEPNTQDLRPTATSLGQRGQERTLSVTFASRERTFSSYQITSPGIWIPKGTNVNPDADFVFRDAYDDIGSIAREIATADWGMGMSGGEVLLGPLPYRIQKQLQIVQSSVWDALTTVLMPLRVIPRFNGKGQLTTIGKDITKTPSRIYDLSSVRSVAQQQADHSFVNSVRIRGLSSEISEVIHGDQRFFEIQGTFGFFDPEMTFRGTWSGDETNSFRVKNGNVVDKNGATVVSPRITNFQQEGFIVEPISPPEFDSVDEFGYVIVIKNDVAQVAAALAALLGGYVALQIVTTVSAELDGGGIDTPNPIAIVAEALGAALLIGGITVLQQIGNFSFEVHGVPFETVYRELVGDANLSTFSAFDQTGGTAVRTFERREASEENYIMSTIDDVTTDDGTVNKGLRSWAREELGFQVARGARRTVHTLRDILLEPGDVVQVDNQIIHVESISRTIERGSNAPQTLNGFWIRKTTETA